MSVGWTVLLLADAVKAELYEMQSDIRAKFTRVVELIMTRGLEGPREPHVIHLEGPPWEMRRKGRDGMARATYITATERRIFILRAFAKKSQKTPRNQIELALRRAREV